MKSFFVLLIANLKDPTLILLMAAAMVSHIALNVVLLCSIAHVLLVQQKYTALAACATHLICTGCLCFSMHESLLPLQMLTIGCETITDLHGAGHGSEGAAGGERLV